MGLRGKDRSATIEWRSTLEGRMAYFCSYPALWCLSWACDISVLHWWPHTLRMKVSSWKPGDNPSQVWGESTPWYSTVASCVCMGRRESVSGLNWSCTFSSLKKKGFICLLKLQKAQPNPWVVCGLWSSQHSWIVGPYELAFDAHCCISEVVVPQTMPWF